MYQGYYFIWEYSSFFDSYSGLARPFQRHFKISIQLSYFLVSSLAIYEYVFIIERMIKYSEQITQGMDFIKSATILPQLI
jgi:hypothetical protein